MARYLFKRKKKTNNFLGFWLLALVSVVPAIVLEHVEAEEPKISGLHAKIFSSKEKTSISTAGKDLDYSTDKDYFIFSSA